MRETKWTRHDKKYAPAEPALLLLSASFPHIYKATKTCGFWKLSPHSLGSTMQLKHVDSGNCHHLLRSRPKSIAQVNIVSTTKITVTMLKTTRP